ncbi:F-box domain-containing protein [Mycena venus]|uniref:F-box domain-containing protein n=1 Tax=Mycena venus TaxID=2733690 RepID=A0A8H6X5L4_9AGAR|nr:F-box domain-containing protein [Mycena venus]
MLPGLAADRARIADLESRISNLERSLAALRLEKTAVQERLDSYKYPVLTLPTEIISEIFIHFLPTYPHCPPLTGPLSPTLLTHTCHAWREIALATPALWRAITIAGNDPSSIQRVRVSNMLSRSGSCPLSIRIEGWAYESNYEPELQEALAAVLCHCMRWEYLAINADVSELPEIQGPFPLLRQLDLWLNDVGLPSEVNTAFQELPQLRTVVLNEDAALHFVLPWIQITRLVLRRVFLHECVPVLRQTSNLVHCEIQLYFPLLHPNDVLDVITFPFLESLIFKDPGSSSTPTDINPLEVFITPALYNLDIPERFLGEKPIESLTSFISKSGCNLQDLRITGKGSVLKGSYRAAFPSIRRFSFDENDEKFEDGGNSNCN